MPQQFIDRGLAPGDGNGENGYTAFGKVNANFLELYNRASYTINVKDYGAGVGGDDTAAFNSAVAAALAFTGPATVFIPCGSYTLSSAIAITLPVSTTQGVYIKGETVGGVKITQTGDANGFTAQINNFGPSLFSSGAVGFSGFTLAMTGTSTTRTGISVTTSASSGAQGIPLVIKDVNLTSASATSFWGTGISINEVTGYTIEEINSTYPAAALGTHLSIQGNATSYSAAGTLRDLYFINGTGLVLGNYIQGLIGERLNIHSLAAGYAIYSAPSAGANLGIQFTDSYFLGRTYFNPSGSASFASIKFSSNYFDALGTVIPAADTLVAFNNVLRLALNNNYYSCTGGSANITGLSLVGTFVTSSINDEQFIACPVGIAVNATTFPIKFSNIQFRPQDPSFVNVVDTSSGVSHIFGADLSMGNNGGGEQYQFPAWTTNGIGMGGQASTITDTTTNSTIAREAFFAFPSQTLNLISGHTGTVTSLSTLFVPAPQPCMSGGSFGILTATNLRAIDSDGEIRTSGGLTANGGNGVQSTAGAVLQGAGVSVNASSNNNTLINTGTSTGTVTVGGGLSPVLVNATAWSVDVTGNVGTRTVLTVPTVVASLSAAVGNQGMRSFVTDATVTTLQTIVVGGGANKVPVYSDGTNWRIG